jgi:hypothetical protein
MYENHSSDDKNNDNTKSSLGIISVTTDYYNPIKTATITNTATSFLMNDRQFPGENIIIM